LIVPRSAAILRTYENPEVHAINRKLQWSGGRRDEYPIFTGASIQA